MSNQKVNLSWIPEILENNDAIVWINVLKLDLAWKNDIAFYIGKRGHGKTKHKYDAFANWITMAIENKLPIKSPHINCQNANNGKVEFTNGRHRFAWLRDHGVKSLPVTTDPTEAIDIQKRFGTRSKRSILILPGRAKQS